jgi:hypothetical protein
MTTKISSIEVSFPVAVEVSNEDMHALDDALTAICTRYERDNPGRIMWVFGTGSKMLVSPFMLSDDEPIPFDESTLHFEISEREGYPEELARRAKRRAPAPASSVEALRWYAEQVAGCRKLGSAGDAARSSLDADGGKRALAAIAAASQPPVEQYARIEFEALWRDMDKSHEVPPEYLNRLSDLIDVYLKTEAPA